MGTSNKRYQIGIDIGATKINAGIIGLDGQIYVQKRMLIGDSRPDENLENQITDLVDSCIKDMGITNQDINFLGIGVPGTVDLKRETVQYAPNLNLRDYDLIGRLKTRYDFDMLLEQDAKSAAIGELLIGAGRGMDDIVCITLGTGIGCGMIIDKQIFRGKQNTAGEIGHIVINASGPACNCGKSGCLEAYASGTGLSKRATEAFGYHVSSKDLFEMAENNPKAAEIVDAGAEAMGIGVVNIINILSPQAIILSGGLSEQSSYIEKIKAFVYQNAYELSILPDDFVFCRAELGSDAPMIGAGLLNQI